MVPVQSPPRELIQEADSLRQGGHIEDATALYLAAIASNPSCRVAQRRLTKVMRGYELPKQLLDQICKRCTELVNRQPNSHVALENLSYALLRQGRVQQANEWVQKLCYKLVKKTHPEFLRQGWPTGLRVGPQFMVIGAMKCGTTSLYSYLVSHPRIISAARKEVRFFNCRWSRDCGIEFYKSFFPPLPTDGGYLTGEATPAYLRLPSVPEGVRKVFPNTRLIVILRNPVHRAVSQYYFSVRRGNQGRPIQEALSLDLKKVEHLGSAKEIEGVNTKYIGVGMYAFHLEKWLGRFPREQLLVIHSDDLRHDPQTTMRRVFDHLRVENHQLSDYKVQNSAQYSQLDRPLFDRLSRFYRPHNNQLEKLLDQEFGWK